MHYAQLEDEVLLCPRCGFNYLHHERVRVFNRPEDDPITRAVRVEDNAVIVSNVATSDSGNPSERRDGLVVDFWCEECGDNLSLCIAQVKGNTVVFWQIGKASKPLPWKVTTHEPTPNDANSSIN